MVSGLLSERRIRQPRGLWGGSRAPEQKKEYFILSLIVLSHTRKHWRFCSVFCPFAGWCLFVCHEDHTKATKQLSLKLGGRMGCVPEKSPLQSGSHADKGAASGCLPLTLLRGHGSIFRGCQWVNPNRNPDFKLCGFHSSTAAACTLPFIHMYAASNSRHTLNW